MDFSIATCIEPNCNRAIEARGLCPMHYRQRKRKGIPLPPKRYGAFGCSVEGCTKPYSSGGYCQMHRARLRRHGDPLVTKTAPEGEGLELLRRLCASAPEQCVEWPYSRNRYGYGQTYYEGRVVAAHRLVCIMAHGEPPTETHQAAHRCGYASCVNPRHVRWLTPVENIAEKKLHGREPIGAARKSAKLTDEKVREILSLKGKMPRSRVAERFGVADPTIKSIWANLTWRHIQRMPPPRANSTVCD